MFFSRKRVGVDLSRHGVRMVLLDGSTSSCSLSGLQESDFPAGAVTFTQKEFTVNDADTVLGKMKDVYRSLNTRVRRAIVSLPDSVGRMLVLGIDDRIKNHAEGLELIRWKLKKRISGTLDDMLIDYQVLETKKNGSLSVLVALVLKPLVEKCETLVSEAGLEPVRIEFNSMSLHRPFAEELDTGGASGLVSFHGGNLGILITQEGVPQFIRNKELHTCEVTDPQVFMELKNSFLSWREQNQYRGLEKIHTLAPPNSASRFDALVAEASGINPLPFRITDLVPTRDADLMDSAVLYPYAAAIGAAWRTV
jgi:type IV pilus assembly protein PilM